MIETSTSRQNVNYLPEKAEQMTPEIIEELDLTFYNSVKHQLDKLVQEPSEDTIAKILAYSRKK